MHRHIDDHRCLHLLAYRKVYFRCMRAFFHIPMRTYIYIDMHCIALHCIALYTVLHGTIRCCIEILRYGRVVNVCTRACKQMYV